MTDSRVKRILDWNEVGWLVQSILQKLPDEPYDIVLVITRGGMVPACLISERLHLRNIMVAAVQFHTRDGMSLVEPVFWQFPDGQLLKDKAVLIVDDVWDSGGTAVAVRDRVKQNARVAHIAVLHFKPQSSEFPDERPDFYGEMTEDWIIYPWDVENAKP
jgi:hypoxanthine phosphoribosyltransferase